MTHGLALDWKQLYKDMTLKERKLRQRGSREDEAAATRLRSPSPRTPPHHHHQPFSLVHPHSAALTSVGAS